MSSSLRNRSGLRRAFFRVLGVGPTDEGHSELDDQVNETVDYFIQHGLWSAQYHIITNTDWHRWISQKEIDTTSGSSSNASTGVLLGTAGSPTGRYVVLEDDFLRLNGDDNVSGLFNSANKSWGSMIDPRHKRQFAGDLFWIEGDRLYFADGANVPSSGFYYEYYARHTEITEDDTDIDFPVELRPLIVAEAANLALSESWLPLVDQGTVNRIRQNLAHWRNLAASKARRSRRPQQLRAEVNPFGDNWM